jgi:hypothetical protein
MNQLLTEPAPAHVRRVGDIARWVGVALVLAVTVAIGMWLVRGPGFVDHISVVNHTDYDLDVDVTGSARDGWMPVSVATRGATTSTPQVVDHDDTWIFRFSHEGAVGGELKISRDQLADAGWRLVVPERVAQELRAADAKAPSP